MSVERYALFFAFCIPMWICGFCYGMFLFPRMLKVLYPSRQIGLAVFWIGLPYIVLRSLYLFVVSPYKLFEWQAILGAYVHLIIVSMACMRGYRTWKKHHYRPQSIKAGLVVAPDGGLHLVEPEIVEQIYHKEVDVTEHNEKDVP